VDEKAGVVGALGVVEDVEAFCWEYMRCIHPELTPLALKALMIEGVIQCYEEDTREG
jgi:hypothetical protein